MNFQVLIQRDEDGIYVASCPAIHGCHTQGKTYEEALKNIKEAIQLNIDYLREKEKEELKEIEFFPKLIATEDIALAI